MEKSNCKKSALDLACDEISEFSDCPKDRQDIDYEFEWDCHWDCANTADEHQVSKCWKRHFEAIAECEATNAKD